jgi:hypothetical protein
VPSFNPPTFMVTPALIARAEDHDRQMNAHRTGAPSQRIYKSNQNKIGFIGELIFGEWLYSQKIYDYEWSEPDLREKGDDWDYKLAEITIDVKTVEVSREYNTPLERQTVRIEEHQMDKKIDLYIFVLYRSDQGFAYILGASTLGEFLEAPSHRYVKLGEPLYPGGSFMAQGNHHAVFAEDLQSLQVITEIAKWL